MARKRGKRSPSRRSARRGKVCEGNVRRALAALLGADGGKLYVGPYGIRPETADELVRRELATWVGSWCTLTDEGRAETQRQRDARPTGRGE